MLALKARFNGKKVVLPKGRVKAKPGTVIVIFGKMQRTRRRKSASWIKAQEKAFAKVWDNAEDTIYDSL